MNRSFLTAAEGFSLTLFSRFFEELFLGFLSSFGVSLAELEHAIEGSGRVCGPASQKLLRRENIYRSLQSRG